jgi:hypothetical protein
MNTATYPFEKMAARTGNLASSVRTIPFLPYSSSFQETIWKYHDIIIVNSTFNSAV